MPHNCCFALPDFMTYSSRPLTSVGIVGVGHIGGALAHSLLGTPGLSLMLYDIRKNVAKGKMKDLEHANIISQKPHSSLTLADSLHDIKTCDIIVVLAGQARQPGMDRAMLLQTNARILTQIGTALKGTEAIVIVVTNPVDTMTHWMYRLMDIPKHRILGMAGTLDEARFIGAVAKILHISPVSVTGQVIGAHNNTMVPLVSSLAWGGMPLNPEHIDRLMVAEVIERTRNGGADIVKLLEQGSAYFGPAEAIKSLVMSIMANDKKVVRASVFVDDLMTSGVRMHQICCGLPVELGHDGWSHTPPLCIAPSESTLLAKSVDSLYEEWQSLMSQEDITASPSLASSPSSA